MLHLFSKLSFSKIKVLFYIQELHDYKIYNNWRIKGYGSFIDLFFKVFRFSSSCLVFALFFPVNNVIIYPSSEPVPSKSASKTVKL